MYIRGEAVLGDGKIQDEAVGMGDCSGAEVRLIVLRRLGFGEDTHVDV